MLRTAKQKGNGSYIQGFNDLILNASANRQALARHKEYIGATKINNFKTSLKSIKHKSLVVFADLQTQIIEELTRDQDLNGNSRQSMELQETPRLQQRAVTPTKVDKTINDDVPCNNHASPEDHTQTVRTIVGR